MAFYLAPSEVIDSVTINAPAAGYIFVSADVHTSLPGVGLKYVLDFTLLNAGLNVVNSKSRVQSSTDAEGEVPIHLSWVFPVGGAGSLQLSTSLYYDNFCACSHHLAGIRSHNLTAIYLPVQY